MIDSRIGDNNNEFIYEVDTGNASVPESTAKKLFNSIVRIEFLNKVATGFFMKIKIKSIYLPCLLTNFHVINQDIVNNKETINIFFGEKYKEKMISIKLDINIRFIKVFNEDLDVAVIEILKSDNIPTNKFLNYDLNYQSEKGYSEYINKDFCLAGYPSSNIFKKERHLSSGTILEIIENFKFTHLLNTKAGSSGSPIILIENKNVIGIHQGGNEIMKINRGIFIGKVIEELNKDDIAINLNYQNFLDEKIEKNKYFFTLEEYKNEIYNLHQKISKYYVNQTENMYYVAIIDLNDYLKDTNIRLEKSREEIISSLEDFSEIQKNYEKIIKSDFIKDINILMKNNFELTMDKFGYFIAGFMKALDLFGIKKDAFLKTESDLEKKKIELDYKDLLIFRKNIDKIISFKSFLNEIAPLTHIHGLFYKFINDVSSKLSSFKNNLVGKNKFSVSFKIKFNHKDNDWLPNCISVSTSNFPEKIFQLFSFFKIKNVIINEENQSGEILLESIGRKEILEEKIFTDIEINYINYNTEENIFEFEK